MADKWYEGLIRPDNKVHTAEFLKELQAQPLERKIAITTSRIIEFVMAAGGVDNVVVSYSGGKDSTVLLHIARQIFPTIKCVYSDTGLEYPEVRAMAREAGADMVRPKMLFPEVIAEYGYPIISKEVSGAIYYARRISGTRERERERESKNKRIELCGWRKDHTKEAR